MTTSVTETTTTLVTLPRVNLLPPEIGAARRLRTLKAGLGAGVGASVLVVGALVLLAAGQVSAAQDDLDASKARGTALQAETTKYDEVPAVYAAVAAKQAQLELAMGREVRWSYFLNDLSLTTPGKVWLTSVAITQNVDQSAVAAPVAPTYGTTGIGTLVVRGSGGTHNDVAAWLRSLAGQKAVADPYFTRSTEEKIGDQDSVSFDSQAVITEAALSGRFTDKAGS